VQVFVDISSLLSSAGRNLPHKCACCSADSGAYCVAISTPVIKCVINLSKSYLAFILVW